MKKANKKSNQRSRSFNDANFEKLIQGRMQNFFQEFNPAFARNEVPIQFARDEHDRVDQAISNLHNSDNKLNQAFFEVLKIKKTDKNLTYAKVVEDYCHHSNNSQEQLFEFIAHLKALYNIRGELGKIINNAPKENSKLEDMPNEESDATIARKVLVLSYLIRPQLNNQNFPDKTMIARFIDSVISKKPSKDIKNSNVYKRVKNLFFNPAAASKADLQFAKKTFQILKMDAIVSEIESTLSKAKQKNQ